MLGYAWLYYEMKLATEAASSAGVCLLKHVTSLPCPSCGTTRSVMAMLQGDWWQAFFLNPFGYLIAGILLLVPLWILFDLFTKRSTLFNAYHKIERGVVKPVCAIPLVVLVLINWIWNIMKGL